MRKPIIAGNWKMNKTIEEAKELVMNLKKPFSEVQDREIVICPPFVLLTTMGNIIKESNIKLGAQNMFWEEKGAYTGEISPLMLKNIGCEYVIIGHSERRAYFGETNEMVNKKIKAALFHNLKPIICVGEKLAEREKGITEKIIKKQIIEGLTNLTTKEMLNIVIAYEPVWAIGTGKTATSEQAQEVHKFIRNLLSEKYGKNIAEETRIQYGGSVNPKNIADLMSQVDIDGALVGGASLKAKSFTKIVEF